MPSKKPAKKAMKKPAKKLPPKKRLGMDGLV